MACYLAQRLDRDSVLREDVTVEQASGVLRCCAASRRSIALYTSRGKSLDEAVEMITSMAERMLLPPTQSLLDPEPLSPARLRWLGSKLGQLAIPLQVHSRRP